MALELLPDQRIQGKIGYHFGGTSMEIAATYSWAIASVAISAFIVQVLNALSGIAKGKANMAPGQDYEPDFSNKDYRQERAYLNSIEIIAFSGVLVLAAILAAAAPFWVNVGAVLLLLIRIVIIYVFVAEIGKSYGGIRTQLAIAQSIVHLAFLVITVVALI